MSTKNDIVKLADRFTAALNQLERVAASHGTRVKAEHEAIAAACDEAAHLARALAALEPDPQPTEEGPTERGILLAALARCGDRCSAASLGEQLVYQFGFGSPTLESRVRNYLNSFKKDAKP